MKLFSLGFNILVINASFLSNIYAQTAQLKPKESLDEALAIIVILNESKAITDLEAFVRFKNLRSEFPEKSTEVDIVILFKQRQLFDKIFDAFFEKHFNRKTEKNKLNYQDFRIYSELLKPVSASHNSVIELTKLNYIITDRIMSGSVISSDLITSWQGTLALVLKQIHTNNDSNSTSQEVGFLSHSLDILTRVSALSRPEFLERADVMELVKQLPIDETKPVEFVNLLEDTSVKQSQGNYQNSQVGFLSNIEVDPIVQRIRKVMQHYSTVFKVILNKKSNNAYARSGIGFNRDTESDKKSDQVLCKQIL